MPVFYFGRRLFPVPFYWVHATAIHSGHKSVVGPFTSRKEANKFLRDRRPVTEWKDRSIRRKRDS